MKYKYEIAPGTYPTLEEELELERWRVATIWAHPHRLMFISAKTSLEREMFVQFSMNITKISLRRAAE